LSSQLALEVSEDLVIGLEDATPWDKFLGILLVTNGTNHPVHVSIGALS
jgi:hypothetical protein